MVGLRGKGTCPIDSSRLKTCGIYAQSTIFGSASLFTPLSSPKLHLNDAFAALMHLNSNRANARWPLNASKCPHRMWLLLENLLHYLHVLNSLALPTAANSQLFKPYRQYSTPCREPEGGSHCIQQQKSECACNGLCGSALPIALQHLLLPTFLISQHPGMISALILLQLSSRLLCDVSEASLWKANLRKSSLNLSRSMGMLLSSIAESKRAASPHGVAEAEQAKLIWGLPPPGSFDGSGECFCRAFLHRCSDIT